MFFVLTPEHHVERIAERDLVVTDGKVDVYRLKLKVSFRYEA